MKIQVLKENFLRAIQIGSRFTANKAHMPVLSHLGIEANKGVIKILASDLDRGIMLRMAGKVDEPGALGVPAKLLLELGGVLAPGTIELGVKDGQLNLVGGPVKAKLQGLSLEDLPRLELEEEVESIGVFDLKEWKHVADRVGFAVAGDETRPVLTGVYWEVNKGLTAAIDGYRLSVVQGKLMAKRSGREKLLVRGGLFQEAVKVFEELGEERIKVDYYPKQQQMVLTGEEAVIYGRLIEGEFPQFKEIVPKEFGVKLILNREEFTKAVRAAAVFARDNANIIRIVIKEGKLTVMANAPQVGEGLMTVEGEVLESGEGEIAFNSRYLLDFLSHAEGEQVIFGMNEALKPGWFGVAGDEGFTHVIMPVRVAGS